MSGLISDFWTFHGKNIQEEKIPLNIPVAKALSANFQMNDQFVIDQAGRWAFKHDYPFDEEHTIYHQLTTDTTLEDILQIAAKNLESLEDKMWVHDLNDLWFEEVIIDQTRKVIRFEIGS